MHLLVVFVFNLWPKFSLAVTIPTINYNAFIQIFGLYAYKFIKIIFSPNTTVHEPVSLCVLV